MFAAFVLERDPLSYKDLPQIGEQWVQIYGGWAAAGLLLWLITFLAGGSRVVASAVPFWQVVIFMIGVVGSGLSYLVYAVLTLTQEAGSALAISPGRQLLLYRLLTAAGGFALVAVLLPFLLGCLKLRPRRIYAIAKVSFKEAMRWRILYVLFGVMILVFLFAPWFVSSKPEDQMRTYVQLVFLAMTPLLLIAATAVASFSIPADIRQQTIHTILTKPVERFEVVLGRFFGYASLMSLALLVMTGAGLIFVLRAVDPRDAKQSFKARDPIYGALTFENTGREDKGTNVGKEWEYRSWITAPMPGQLPQRAIWTLPNVPEYVSNRDTVTCEFNFYLYRTQTVSPKEKQNEGLLCRFIFRTHNFIDSKLTREQFNAKKEDALTAEKSKPAPRTPQAVEQEVIEKYGYFEVPVVQIIENRIQSIEVPAAFFRNARTGPRASETDAVQVQVQCDSIAQYVGVARYDLYLRKDNPQSSYDTARFSVNFLKGALGLWFKVLLVTGIGVALSTYLSGVVSMLVTLLLYAGGLCRDFIQAVALGNNFGGGPARALVHIASRQALGAASMTEGPNAKAADRLDIVFRWIIRRVLELIPDVTRFDLTDYVAEGFNIGCDYDNPLLFVNVLFLVGYYLLPCAVLAFYLIRWREVAAPT